MEEYKRKIVLLGDGAVGKTSLVRRYVEQKFSDQYITTIGANFKKKTLTYDDEEVKLNLLIGDLLGQKGFQNTQKANMRGSSGALVVCDLTRKETRESIEEYWLPLLVEVIGKAPPLIFLANKCDLIDLQSDDAKEYRQELLDLSEKYGTKFFFTSAKTGENVEQAFSDMGLLVLNRKPTSFFEENLYRVEGEISPTKALDMFKAQLYVEIGGEEFVNPILQNQLPRAGIDIKEDPSIDQLEDLVEKFKELEADFLGEEGANKYYFKRKAILSKVKEE